MNITILKKNLKDGLSVVGNSISENSHLPVLKYILIKTVNHCLECSTTNLELASTTFVSGKIIQEGSIAVPFATFSYIVNNCLSERINLEVKSNNLIITTDNYEAKIQGVASSDFPIIPKIKPDSKFIEFSSDLLKESLNQVLNSVQISEIRPELSGVLFDLQDNGLTLVGTDSFRLSIKKLNSSQFKTNIKDAYKFIIPLKTITEVVRVFLSADPITIFIDQNQILIKNSTTEIISRLIDGAYPDYEQIIPKTSETELNLEKEQLVSALKLVSSFSSKINDAHLKIKDKTNTLEVYSSNQNIGENNYLIPVKIKGIQFSTISFNWRYLLDGLKVLKSNNVLFSLNGDTKPAFIKSEEDNSYTYIVMPIRLS